MKSISPDDKGEITMVKILAGEKGEGKTKKMIAMANEAGKTASGSIVFVDDDNSHMYDLHYRGFVCGILSQNSDIETIYIDGLNHIVDKISDVDFVEFIQALDKTSAEAKMDMVMIISRKADLLPQELSQYIVTV